MMNDLKSKFHILGFTGPLRSGCTTAANFFADDLSMKSKRYAAESVQTNVEEIYKEIASLLREAPHEDNILKKKKGHLNRLLREREIKKALSGADLEPYYYISMSEMLIKYALEFLMVNKSLNGDLKYLKIIEILRAENADQQAIRRINEQIMEKKYRDIDWHDIDFYDSYLKEIAAVVTKIRNELGAEVVGDILQDMGDNIRKHGNPFQTVGKLRPESVFLIADQANKLIKFMRNRQDAPENRRHHFLIECFRNPYEVEYFRYRYYEFYLFSIFAEKKEREKRGSFVEARDTRDRGEGNKPSEINKQNVARCVYLSDVALNNNSSKEAFFKKLLNYYSLILRPGCVSATFDETFMNQAYSLSLRSNCISRQVGAVITGKHGYVIGAGWNDAGEGQIGCGYRQIIDIKNLSPDVMSTNPIKDESFRRYLTTNRKAEHAFCYKDEYSLYIMRKKFKEFMKERKVEFDRLGAKEVQQEMIEEWLSRDIKIKRLEYCRALHAEENALLQTAKIGGIGVKGGTLYTTTFPCELCAKKIYQSGIKKIVYTEPYPESISQEVFLKDGIKRVRLAQFEGVKSHSYYRLYKAGMDKKDLQALQNMPGPDE